MKSALYSFYIVHWTAHRLLKFFFPYLLQPVALYSNIEYRATGCKMSGKKNVGEMTYTDMAPCGSWPPCTHSHRKDFGVGIEFIELYTQRPTQPIWGRWVYSSINTEKVSVWVQSIYISRHMCIHMSFILSGPRSLYTLYPHWNRSGYPPVWAYSIYIWGSKQSGRTYGALYTLYPHRNRCGYRVYTAPYMGPLSIALYVGPLSLGPIYSIPTPKPAWV